MTEIALDCVRRNLLPPASNIGSEESEAAPSDCFADVLDGCLRKDPAAQRHLVQQTQDLVYRVVLRLVGVQDAEDVCQQVYLQVFRSIDRFRGGSLFTTWLYKVTVNEAMQHLRRRRTYGLSELDADAEDKGSDERRQIEARELLDRALGGLDPELRSIFVLREVEGLSYREIASVLGIPEGTVASRLSRARDELQERLRALGWDG